MIISAIIIINILALLLITVVKVQAKGHISLGIVLINASFTSWLAIHVLSGVPIDISFYGGQVFGEIPIRIDSLSGWFILITNLTLVTGILYGVRYMAPYKLQSSNLTLHYISYIINHVAMLAIFTLQNSLAFLCSWELMAVTTFLMVIFEHQKMRTLKAGINYLVQSHLCILFLTIGFMWVSAKTGSYDFKAISLYSAAIIPALSFFLFCCFFIGFAFKAGFVPFHTWLPYAHPAAPAHVSGIMSGVIIKLGIFGILRMLLLINENHLQIGYTILVISIITGIYGVMLAIIQHDLKKLLAYHSIENIGIIGIGIGLGTIGLGLNNPYLIFAGFAGALLHTFNHSLFKSLLFYGAGTVYQATHTVNIEKLGGLIKKMPQSATLFLIASLAICGLPPLNGFISEFLIYAGLFGGIRSGQLIQAVIIISTIFSLTIIGGLAMLCFTKAFGTVFLGSERHSLPEEIQEADLYKLFPKYILALFIIAIGMFPSFFLSIVAEPVSLFSGGNLLKPIQLHFIDTTQMIGLAAFGLIMMSLLVLGIKKLVNSSSRVTARPTWACGYEVVTPQLQYSANSFVRTFRKLIRPLLIMNKKEEKVIGVFPQPIQSVSNPYDKLELFLIDKPIKHLRSFMKSFRFVQNGSVQSYISYGSVFIFIAISVPLLIYAVEFVVNLLKQF